MNISRRWIACAAVVPFLFVATGCGDESFDPKDLQNEIAKSVKSELGEVDVKCPDDISAKKGTKVTCTATDTDGTATKLLITIADDKGNFTIAPAA